MSKENKTLDNHQKGKDFIDDLISRLKKIQRFNLAHYRDGEYGIETEREEDYNGDYIDAHDIDLLIKDLSNGI